MESRSFFIIGCGRSGTTAVARILDTAENATVFVENNPKLCIAARMKREGILPYPEEFILKSTARNIQAANERGLIYGDKNPNYVYFVKELLMVYHCKFLFVVRDGRDVVTSCINFDRHRTPNYYRYEDDPNSDLTQPEEDFWDFARLRPLRDDSIFNRWRSMGKFEKFCWYWANYNKLLIDATSIIPKENWRVVNMTKDGVDQIEKIFEFLGLVPFLGETIDQMFKAKINTSITIGKRRKDVFPEWGQWSDEQKDVFLSYCFDIMRHFDYV
ncbi:MAG: sulfotransferase [Candidatus Hodarchaeota archaeon]